MNDVLSGQRLLRRHAERHEVDYEVEDPLKIRVGLGTGAALTADQVWTVTDAAEASGLDSLWFSERLAGDQLAPLSLMAAVAGRTHRIRFGSSVLMLPGRNPVLLAKEIATIDRISEGRLIPVFGLVSQHSDDRPLLRIPHGAAGRWADESLSVMRRLWAGETVDHAGEFFTYSKLRVGPRDADSPHLDVWTGGHSDPAISRAGSLADGWLPSFLPVERYLQSAMRVVEAAGIARRSWDLA